MGGRGGGEDGEVRRRGPREGVLATEKKEEALAADAP